MRVNVNGHEITSVPLFALGVTATKKTQFVNTSNMGIIYMFSSKQTSMDDAAGWWFVCWENSF